VERFAEEHRSDVVELLRRTLLPEDAVEADEIVARLRVTPGPGFVQSYQGRVVGVAFASVGHADPTAGHLDLIAVDPEHRGQGFGTRLIHAAERGLTDLGCTSVRIAGNAPDYAWPGIDVRYTSAICAVTANAYHHDQTAWNMSVDLTDPGSPALRPTSPGENRLADQGIAVRAATGEDIEALLPVVEEEWGHAWVREVADARGVHVAVRDGVPIAFAAWGGARSSWFGPMGTLPAAEGLGIGSVLLRRCLRQQAESGLVRVQIGWVGPVPFYARAANAYIERVFFLYRKTLISPPHP
jgi:GNAT superfamily N-acetyltransferase